MARLDQAFKLSKDYEFGAAFDLELQEKRRLDKLALEHKRKKEMKRAKREEQREKERALLEA